MVGKLDIRYPDFGDRVRQAMKMHGITKSQIQRDLGVKGEMARRYVAGIAKPRHDKMVKLAELLRFESVAELEYGDRPSLVAREPSPAAAGLSQQAVELARMWMRLPDFKQRGYLQGIMTDAAILEVFPELQTAMRTAAIATDPKYHKLTEGFERSRAQLERQLKLKLDP